LSTSAKSLFFRTSCSFSAIAFPFLGISGWILVILFETYIDMITLVVVAEDADHVVSEMLVPTDNMGPTQVHGT
jgi:hypothetical protein